MNYISIILISLFSSFSLNAAVVEGQERSIYETLVNSFEEPAVSTLSFDEMYGNYIGRCFSFDKPNESTAALLVVSKKEVSDNGPLFPASYERKAITIWGPKDVYFDGLKQLPYSTQLNAAANWDDHTELSKLGDSWEFEVPGIDLRIYFKNSPNGLIATYYTEGEMRILSDKQRLDFQGDSYKKVYQACYYFQKFPGMDIKDIEDYNPYGKPVPVPINEE